ncbi:MAG: PepSY-like domain-containing protein [Flavisolibacter sp.]|nr:PepSY-like domain-containing protein [Flavisolibacter sp.]
MKNIIKLLALIILAACNAGTTGGDKKEDKEVAASSAPDAVQSAFKAKYPGANNIEWDKDGEDYESKFTLGGVKHSAKWTKEGQFVKAKKRIMPAALPEVISKAVATNFPGYEIKKIDEVEGSQKGTAYEVDIEKGSEQWELDLSANGELLKKKEKDKKSK